MARFASTVESSTALVATAPSGGTANSLFANLVLTAAATAKIRRVTLGVRAGTGAPTSQQVTVATVRTTARGTQSTAQTPAKLDPNSAASNASVDVAWSAVPTATWTAPYFYEVSFNTQSGVDLPWELLEELLLQGSGNGLAFINVGNALPTAHLYTMAIEWEE
jgi:hypothetical protein